MQMVVTQECFEFLPLEKKQVSPQWCAQESGKGMVRSPSRFCRLQQLLQGGGERQEHTDPWPVWGSLVITTPWQHSKGFSPQPSPLFAPKTVMQSACRNQKDNVNDLSSLVGTMANSRPSSCSLWQTFTAHPASLSFLSLSPLLGALVMGNRLSVEVTCVPSDC